MNVIEKKKKKRVTVPSKLNTPCEVQVDRWGAALAPVAQRGCGGVRAVAVGGGQGLTLLHFSAQLEPCLTHKNTLHTLHTPSHPLNMGYAIPTRTPYPIKSAPVELRSERV
jgi:hypothetical protein